MALCGGEELRCEQSGATGGGAGSTGVATLAGGHARAVLILD